MDTKNFLDKYLTPIAVLVGAAVIAFALIYGHGAMQGQQAANGQPAAQAVDIKDVKLDEGDPFIGNANAPVVMAFWFDYQCPFCKQFEDTVTGQLYDNYVKSGKLKIVFKDFQFLGDDSMTGAEYARAVWEAYPDHFYDWYKAMFAAQDDEGDQGFGDADSVKKLTATIPGIDADKVAKLVADKKTQYDAAITEDRTEGASFGVNGTPALIIGTTLLSGAQPYSTVSGLIDAQLKK